jgi:cytochrome c oxidase subunit II
MLASTEALETVLKPSKPFHSRRSPMSRTRITFVGVITPILVALSSAHGAAAPFADPPGQREINVTARRFEFTPKTITVSKGERVRLAVTSEDVDHGFAIKEFGIDMEIKAKQTRIIELTPDKEGRFRFTCSVFCGEGHGDMVGELIVTRPPIESDSRMKVTFDPATPGVVIVESGGERLRIDTSRKTFDRISEPASGEKADAQAPVVATKERESSKVYEPYDYHIVNIPTPKAVRKHSLNMHFTHRFQETITRLQSEDFDEHVARISKDLLGLDSSSVSSFGVTYGITDRLYATVYRSPLCQPGLCKTIEIGLGYHFLDEAGRSPIALSAYTSVEGDYNFTERYTYNFQAMIGRSVTQYVNVFFSPAAHINANGGDRFKEFLFSQPLAAKLRLGQHSGSFGFGINARVLPTTSLLFEYTPRVGFKLGQITPEFDTTVGQVTRFKNVSEAAIGFGIEKRIGRHVFSLTFSNTQTTTTARYNSSNQALAPSKFSIGFNLFRRLL